jgi:hypothetical protein
MTGALACEPTSPPRVRVTAHHVPDADPPYDDGYPPVRLRPDRTLSTYVADPVAELRLVAAPPAASPARGPRGPASFEAVRTPRDELEDPVPRAAMLARALVEVLDGLRPLGQLTRWVRTDVLDVLQPMVAGRRAHDGTTAIRRVLVSEPTPGVAEVTAIVQRGARAEALALRLEGLDGRWLVTAVQRP